MKHYMKLEVEIEADNADEAQTELKKCLEGKNYATDTIMMYPSGFFERKMDLYREYGVKIY